MTSWNPLTASNSVFENDNDNNRSSTHNNNAVMSDSDVTSLLVSLHQKQQNNNNNNNNNTCKNSNIMFFNNTTASGDDSLCRTRSPSQGSDQQVQQFQQHQVQQQNNVCLLSSPPSLSNCSEVPSSSASSSCGTVTPPLISSSASSLPCYYSSPSHNNNNNNNNNISPMKLVKPLSKDSATARAFVPRQENNSNNNNKLVSVSDSSSSISLLTPSKIQQLNNQHFISKVANAKYNLHSLLPEQAGLLTVPFVTQELYDKMMMLSSSSLSSSTNGKSQQVQEEEHQGQEEEESSTTSPSSSSSTVKLFFGQGPLVPNEQVYRLLCMAVAGVNPISIKILDPPPPPKHVSNPKILTKPPLVLVEVTEQDAQKVIASIHKRVIFDQASFHVAVTKDQVRLLHNYSKMLSVNPTARFQHRPYTAVTVTRASPKSHPKGAPPLYDNEYNPLCPCEKCEETFAKSSTTVVGVCGAGGKSCFLFDEYLTEKYAFNTVENPHPLFFLKTHAFVDKNELANNEVKQKLYSDVSDIWIRKCNENARQKWNQYSELSVPTEVSLCKLLSNGSNGNNGSNTNQNQQQQQQQPRRNQQQQNFNYNNNMQQMKYHQVAHQSSSCGHNQGRYPFVALNNNNNISYNINNYSLPPPPPPPPSHPQLPQYNKYNTQQQQQQYGYY